MQVTEVVPGANSAPEAGLHTGAIAPSTASLADALKVTFAPAAFNVCTEIWPGTVTTGGALSATSTEKLPVEELPALSVTRHVTVVVPTPNAEPDAGEHDAAIAPSTVSLADAA